MKILHAIHDFLPRHRAGSEIYADELCRQLQRRGHETHVLCAEYDWSRPHGSLGERVHEGLPVTELVNNWFFTSFAESYASATLNRQLERVLAEVAPDVLHVHNLLNLSMDLPALARAAGIPCVATLHDFTLLCPSGGQRVHLAERHVCVEIDPERCARCFPQSVFHGQMLSGRVARHTRGEGVLGRAATRLRGWLPAWAPQLGRTALRVSPKSALEASDIRTRLEKVREVYQHVALFVAPSPALGADYERFGLPAAKIRVSDYGFHPLTTPARKARPGRLRIGFVGTITWHKGVHVLVEAMGQLDPERVELRVFGDPEVSPDYSADLRERASGLPVRFEGGFSGDQAPEVYAGIDVLVVPSLWPENSPLVIHEAFMAGVPVVGARMGGIADLVTHGESGLLYDAFSAASLAGQLQQLVDDPDALARLAAGAPSVKSMEQDAAEWEQLYREVARASGEAPSR